MDRPKLTAHNWVDMQHYKDRAPPWIKLHKKLLDNYEFHRLPDASRALAPMLWLLASEETDGAIEYDLGRLAFRLRQTEEQIDAALKPLIAQGFFHLQQPASTTLAPRKQEPRLETETETETEKEGEREARPAVDNPTPTPTPTPSPAVLAVVAMRKAGLMDVTSSDPRLLTLVEQGATAGELATLAGEAVAKGKGWAWLVATLNGRRQDAAKIGAPVVTAPKESAGQYTARMAAERAAEAERMASQSGPSPEVAAKIAALRGRRAAA